MKKKNWLGMLAIALVFGMMVVGCKDDNGEGGGKKLTITGITGISAVTVIIGEEGDNFVAGGSGTVSNGSVTIALKNLNTTDYSLSGDFSGGGNYGIMLWPQAIQSGGLEAMGEPEYVYSSGSTISFANETTTVSWSGFSKEE